MTYKSIVACMTESHRYDHTLSAAASLAEAGRAHLSVLCLGVDRTNPGAYYAGGQALVLQSMLETAQTEAVEAEFRAEARLKDLPTTWDTQSITTQLGSLGPVVGERTVFSDLVVLPRPYGEDSDAADVVILEAVLFQTRVPVLVLPEKQESWTQPGRVAIAWNHSPEALAAARGAMPILARAETVDIVIVDPPRHAPDRSDPGGAFAQMLARHGIGANISIVAKTMPRISEVLGRHCADMNADLLVMGAYGHSRLREAIMGGATRNLLEVADLPVLMAH